MISIVLELLKIDLGITHSKRDKYFRSLIGGCIEELKERGIMLDENEQEDVMLLSDYSAWRYRMRDKDVVALSKNLEMRIKNRIVKEICNEE